MADEVRDRYAAEYLLDMDALAAAERCGITESEALRCRMEADFPEAVRRAAVLLTLGRTAAEYEALAFASPEAGEIKAADKLRALGEYARLLKESSLGGSGSPLTVVYDYRG